ncbi:hypothetical protein KY312_02055 [Candidatus Woesearchaeota archaeon]|nr:hypothetical protein [Candidatus Woesearchaeota archaeon]
MMTQTMTMQVVPEPEEKINSGKMIEELEEKLKEHENCYARKIEEIKNQYGPGIESYREFIREHVDRLKILIGGTNFVENIIFDPDKTKRELEKAASVDNEVLVRISGIEKQAFKDYVLGVEAVLASVMEPTARLLEERNELLMNMRPTDCDESIGDLKEKLKILDKMIPLIRSLEKNNPHNRIATTYYQEFRETNERIDAIEKQYSTMKKITEEPLYYPVQVMTGRETETVIYVFPKNPSIHAKLFDRAVTHALKEANAEKVQQGNSSRFRRYTNFQANCNIVELVKKELEKPEYVELRKANIIPRFYEIPANGENLLPKQHPESRLYTTKEIAEELNVRWSNLRNWIYTANRDLLQYSVRKGGRLFFTKQGFEKIQEYIQQKKAPKKEHKKPTKRISQTEKMLDMYHSGHTMEKIAEILGVATTTVCRNLKKAGLITWYSIAKDYNTLDKIKNAKFEEFPVYPKQSIRDEMLLEMIDNLRELENIRYLGLEGPNFGSYIELADAVTVDRPNSVIAENNKRAYRMIESIVRNAGRIEGGQIFKDLNLFYGDLSDAVDQYRGKRFNFVNLDYMGSFSKEKMHTMGKLFENSMFMDNAVLYITLSNHERDKERLKRGSNNLPDEFKNGFGTGDQHKIVGDYLRNLASMTGYTIHEINCREYKSKKTPMLFMSYRIEKKCGGEENGTREKTNI